MIWHMNPTSVACDPPLLCHMNRFYGGWGLVFNIQKPGNHPNFEKHALGVKRPFSEQLSEFRGILGAILGMALTT